MASAADQSKPSAEPSRFSIEAMRTVTGKVDVPRDARRAAMNRRVSEAVLAAAVRELRTRPRFRDWL